MPVPTPPASSSAPPPIFPALTIAQVDAARLSAWYDKFEDLTIESTVIDLETIGEKKLFLEWLDSDSIFIPTEDDALTSEAEGSAAPGPSYRLPKLGRRMRELIQGFGGGVFPKLNWTAPRDAAFLLPQTPHGPLYCASAHDVYLLLKSSDFLSHALDPERAYEGCSDFVPQTEANARETAEVQGETDRRNTGYKVELILRRYESINPSREFRCFVRQDMLIGISVRDFNYYPHLQDPSARERLCETIRSFWEDEIRGDYDGGKDYVFDIVLDEPQPRLLDFNPYNPSTDPLLFTYEELHELLIQALEPVPSFTPAAAAAAADSVSPDGSTGRPRLPILRVIDSQSHPEANRGMPAFGTNMMPVEMVEMSQGRGVGEFRSAWEEAVREGMDAEASDSDSEDGDGDEQA